MRLSAVMGLHAPYTPGQMTYDLRRLRLADLIQTIESGGRAYLLGIKFAVFYTEAPQPAATPAHGA